jgi:hypothetical protein
MSLSEYSAIEMTDALRGPRGRLNFGATWDPLYSVSGHYPPFRGGMTRFGDPGRTHVSAPVMATKFAGVPGER